MYIIRCALFILLFLYCYYLGMDLLVLPLHKYPHFKEQCCNLINDEWKRSTTARMRSLDSSCDKLPTSLVLIKCNKVIGHCKLSPIPSIKNACFIEAMVIDKGLRGRGYGRHLMTKAEEYCRDQLDFKNIYLSTKDQEIFYSKLGYKLCKPISIYGSYTSSSMIDIHSCSNSFAKNEESTNKNNAYPCPPPLPKSDFVQNSKIYMSKLL